MPLVQGSALWSLQRVFNHPMSSREPQTKAKTVPSQGSSFWKSSSGPSIFLRRLSSAPCSSPKRSASAPHGIRDIPLQPSANMSSDSSPKPSSSKREDCTPEKSISKSVSVPHTFVLKPNTLQLPETNAKSLQHAMSSSTLASSEGDFSPSVSSPSPLDSDPSAEKATTGEPLMNPEDSVPTVSKFKAVFDLKSVPPQLAPTQQSSKSQPANPASKNNLCNTAIRSPPSKLSSLKSNGSHTTACKRLSTGSSHNSSPTQSPLKTPPPPASRRASTQGEPLPVAPSPPWSELIEARRRLLAVEGRRRALCALEMRVQQVHCVFLQAELRVARQREGLAKLVEAAGRAEVQAAVHGQRIRRVLRHQKPRLLACALCVPWPSKQERRGGPHPRHPRCALFQSRSQVLRACVGGE